MIEEKLRSLGIILSEPPSPAGSYVPVVIDGNIAYVSGQIPVKDGKIMFTGKVEDNNMEQAKESAKLCAVNILSQLKKELGNLDRVSQIIKLAGFVNASEGFTSHPKVINAASDLFFDVFGNRGRHARIAVGVSSLPLNAMTEIDAVVRFN